MLRVIVKDVETRQQQRGEDNALQPVMRAISACHDLHMLNISILVKESCDSVIESSYV